MFLAAADASQTKEAREICTVEAGQEGLEGDDKKAYIEQCIREYLESMSEDSGEDKSNEAQ